MALLSDEGKLLTRRRYTNILWHVKVTPPGNKYQEL
jgi:hypothetical protein